MAPAKSLPELLKQDKQWLVDYMNNNPGANQIDTYIISVNSLKENFKCGLKDKCLRLSKDCKDPDCEELRLFLLCFSCNRIFHQRCSETIEEDLVAEKTPWICQECIKNPLNAHAVEFFKSKGHNTSLKQRLEFFSKNVEIPSPKQKGVITIDDEELLEISELEQSLNVNFTNLNPTNMSRLLGSKLVQQQKEFDSLRQSLLESEKEKLKLSHEISKKSAENSVCLSKIEKLEKMVNERLFLQDSKLRGLEESGENSKSHFKPSMSANPMHSTMIDHHSGSQQTIGLNEEQKMKQASFSIKILTVNDIKEQIARELGYIQSNSASSSRNVLENQSNVSAQLAMNSERANMSTSELVTIEHVNRMNLNEIRKNLPKIEPFDGNVDQWLTFERAINRNRREGQYSDELTKYHIRQALKGQALARVDDLMDFSTADEIMSILRESYGCSNNIVVNARNKLLAVKLSKPLTHSSAIEVTTKIASYMAACKYAHLPLLDMSISLHIHQQLDPIHQQQYYNYYFAKHPGETRMERLDIQLEFLNDIARTLPMNETKTAEKKEPMQKSHSHHVMSVSAAVAEDESNPNSFVSNFHRTHGIGTDDFKYEIRSKEKAPYIGYDMEKVKYISKNCDICGSTNHFPVECAKYREMSLDQRYNIIRAKEICSNCLLTTDHHAKECNVKIGCGYRVDRYLKCVQKHHISLHRSKSNSEQTPKKQHHSANESQNIAADNDVNKNNQQNSIPTKNTDVTSSPENSVQVQSISAHLNDSKYRGYVIQSDP